MLKKNFNQNHFEKFSLPISFTLDVDELENHYLKLQKQFHPDSLIGKNNSESMQAVSNSIAVNEAFEILKNPIKRAIYLLQLNDLDIDSETSSIKPSQEVLMAIIEIREAILEAENLEEKNKIKKSIQVEIKEIMLEVAQILDQKQYQAAAQKIIKAKYLDKILVDLKK